MIKTILFDIDGVLIDSFEANFRFIQALFVKGGYPPPNRDEYVPLFQMTMMDVIKTVTTSEKEIERIMQIGKEDRADMYSYDLITSPKHLEEILKKLHTSYTLGLVTSRLKKFIFDIKQLQTVEKYFSIVVSFEDTEKHKPHPDPLLYAINQLKILPEETIYVGDQQADFLAARAAGTKIIMLTEKSFPDADACITSFEDIPNAILKVA